MDAVCYRLSSGHAFVAVTHDTRLVDYFLGHDELVDLQHLLDFIKHCHRELYQLEHFERNSESNELSHHFQCIIDCVKFVDLFDIFEQQQLEH